MQGNQQELERLAQKKHSPASGVMWRMLIFSLVIFFLMIAVYIGTEFGYKIFLQNQNESIRAEAENLISGVPKEEQVAVIDYYSRLSNMKSLLDDHVKASIFLDFLEKRTSQNVYLNKVIVTVDEETVKASGTARTFLDLSRQIQAWQETEGISGVILDSSNLSQNGQVSFTVLFNLSKKNLLSIK